MPTRISHEFEDLRRRRVDLNGPADLPRSGIYHIYRHNRRLLTLNPQPQQGQALWHPQAVKQPVKRGDLALGRYPVLVKHALGADPVNQHEQLIAGKVDINTGPDLAEFGRLRQVPGQPRPEPVELAVLPVTERRIAQGPAPETDLDLRFQLPPIVNRQRLKHDDPQRAEPAAPGRAGVHPGGDPIVALAMPSLAITRHVADKHQPIGHPRGKRARYLLFLYRTSV